MSLRCVVVASVSWLLVAFASGPSGAQTVDTVARPAPRGVRFSGTIASMETTRPVAQADVRIMYIDSVQNEKGASAKLAGEFFVDSAKSHVGITNDSGFFAINNMPPGHYLINVRRIGFAPFEGLLTLDTARVEMELAMTQVIPILPAMRITESAVNTVTERLDRVGFVSRSHEGTGAIFITRADILRQKTIHVTDLLEARGVSRDAIIDLDRMETDWDTLRDYPADLVIGIEIYRRRGELPIEFNRTRSGELAMSPGGNGGISPPTVLIWTYIP